MTEPRPLTDEDLSAALDGEAGPEVIRRAQANSAARARMEALRGVGEALRATSIEPLADSTVDQLVGRALAAADHQPEPQLRAPDGATSSADAEITPLAPPHGARRTPPWLVAAAIAALMAIGLGLVWSGRGDDGGTTQTAGSADRDQSSEVAATGSANGAGDRSTDASESDSGSARSADADAPSPSADPAEVAPVDLGSFADDEALRRALSTSFPEFEAPATDPEPDDSTEPNAPRGVADTELIGRCDTQLRHLFQVTDPPTHVGTALLAGEDVIVFEYRRPSFADETVTTTFVSAVDATTCSPQLSFERDAG